jgi:superoxide dismutase
MYHMCTACVAQVWNHTFFWESMKANGGGEPQGKLADAIKASFGSLDEFKTQFKAAGANSKPLFRTGGPQDCT